MGSMRYGKYAAWEVCGMGSMRHGKYAAWELRRDRLLNLKYGHIFPLKH